MTTVRLDKYLAEAGAGSRSEVKKYVLKGQVQVNGQIVKNPSMKVDWETDQISFQGEMLSAREFEYYLLYKPAGCVSATQDPVHRTVMEYVPASRKELFPVGRLDKDTEGLLLITNDGDLAHRLLSPRNRVPKVYCARTRGRMTQEDVQAFEQGMDIGEKKKTLPAKLVILSEEETQEGWESWVRITVQEGKFHQVKRMVDKVGKEVVYLKRIAMGPLSLEESLGKGGCRPLTERELEALRDWVW